MSQVVGDGRNNRVMAACRRRAFPLEFLFRCVFHSAVPGIKEWF